jgi:hypothetical protein
VGLEAFAGHQDYPYYDNKDDDDDRNNNKKTSKKTAATATQQEQQQQQQNIEENTQQDLPTEQEDDEEEYSNNEPYTLSSDLATIMDDYQSSITSIRLPTTKSNAVERVRNSLQPFYASLEKERWSDTKKRFLL